MRRIDQALSVRDGRLFIEEVACDELARRFGTPLYVVSEDQLRRNARSFQSAFAERWSEGSVRVLPSLKANYALALRHVLTQEGMGCDTFGPSELTAALGAGVPPAMISVNGTGKSAALIDDAVAAGARITIDAARELPLIVEAARRLGTRATVRLRLRPDLSDLTDPTDFDPEGMPTSEMTRSYKAGIPTEDVVELGRRAIASDALDLSGVHVHLPRHRPETGMYRTMIGAFVDLVAQLSRDWGGWVPREIDIGGGFAVPRDPTGRLLSRLADRSPAPAPTIDEYAEVITTSLRRELGRHGMNSRRCHARARAGSRSLRRCGHPSRERGEHQARVEARSVALGRDRHDRDVPAGLVDRAQPMDGAGRLPSRTTRRSAQPTSWASAVASTSWCRRSPCPMCATVRRWPSSTRARIRTPARPTSTRCHGRRRCSCTGRSPRSSSGPRP